MNLENQAESNLAGQAFGAANDAWRLSEEAEAEELVEAELVDEGPGDEEEDEETDGEEA